MSDKLELAKQELNYADGIVKAYQNPVIKSVVDFLKTIVPLGSFIDAYTEKQLNDFQNSKLQKFIDLLVCETSNITSDMVNDIEFIMNFKKTVEAVYRLSTNDKVEYFSNLLRNSYLAYDRIDNDVYDEYIHVLNTLSYREIRYLKFIFQHGITSDEFGEAFATEFNMSRWDYPDIYKRLVSTGFVQEDYSFSGGRVDQKIVASEYDDEFKLTPPEMNVEFYATERLSDFVERISDTASDTDNKEV